jgi:hypothetical protein
MDKKIKELWVVPLIIALATGIPLGVLFTLLGLWLAGTPIHASFSINWLEAVLSTTLPVWVTLVVVAVATLLMGLYSRQRAKTAEQKALKGEYKTEIEKRKTKEPRLHAIWNQQQVYWTLAKQGETPLMQIGGWIDLTSSNTHEVLFLLAAYIGEHRSQIFTEIEVKPNEVNRRMVMLFIAPLRELDDTKPYNATIVVEDQYNRRFSLPPHRFPAVAGPISFPTSGPEKSAPKLHISWRGNSGWCWRQHQREQVVRISGDAPILLENAEGKVLITGVQIEGAEFVGVFDNFELTPGQGTMRGMNLDFKGIKPAGEEPVTVKMTFVDLRGNKYPTNETTFRPLETPHQYGGLPWPQ